MQSELAVYQHKMKAIEAGRLPSASGDTGNEEDKYPDLADLEPELREAYIKMRKLDRILEKRVKREREVKRDRILLERRYFWVMRIYILLSVVLVCNLLLKDWLVRDALALIIIFTLSIFLAWKSNLFSVNIHF